MDLTVVWRGAGCLAAVIQHSPTHILHHLVWFANIHELLTMLCRYHTIFYILAGLHIASASLVSMCYFVFSPPSLAALIEQIFSLDHDKMVG